MNDLFNNVLNSEGSEELKSVVRLMQTEIKARDLMFNVTRKVVDIPEPDFNLVSQLTVIITSFKDRLLEIALTNNIKI